MSILFSVIIPMVTAHGQLLARLAHALHDPGFRRSVVATKRCETIVREARRSEMPERLAQGSVRRAA